MTAKIAIIINPSDLSPAIDAVASGDVVGMPTETVYGLAGNAFDAKAVTKIFASKERPSFDPLIVHVSPDLTSVESLSNAGIINASALSSRMTFITQKLMDSFWPGPLTLILPKSNKIPDLVTSGLERVGVRMPSHPVAQKLLRQCGKPLAAPSANRFGRISPTTANHVMEELGDRIPVIIDGGACDIGVESTVVAVDEQQIWLLRPGKISAEELTKASGVPVTTAPSEHEKASPGMLASHYAPKKPLYMLPDFAKAGDFAPLRKHPHSFALMITCGHGNAELQSLKSQGLIPMQTIVLSPDNDAAQVARQLFSAMRMLDASSADILLTNEIGALDNLWPAINDRVRRASTKN
jgi:L-threonylcarbamoyladenylate synthase